MHLNTIIVLFVTVCLMGITHSINFQSNRQLGSMVYYLSGRDPSDFLNYGCWCSNKDRPTLTPLDELDQCCQVHQKCNSAINDKTDVTPYPYQASYEDGTIECMNNAQTKAHRHCQCDRDLAGCLNKHQEVYTNNLLYTSDEKCSPAIVLNFDDLITNTSSTRIPDNYYNFTITNAYYTAGSKSTDRPGSPNGYAKAMVSPPNVLFSQNHMTIKRTDGQPFSVVSFSAAAAMIKNLTLTLVGSRQYSPVIYTESVLLNYDIRSNIELNWFDIDTLSFNATGGALYPAHSGVCGNCHFAIDNLRLRL